MGEDWSKGQNLDRNEERTVVEGFSDAQAGGSHGNRPRKGIVIFESGKKEEISLELVMSIQIGGGVDGGLIQQPLERAGPGLLGEPHL